jgi:hypothetical protein
MISKPAFSVLCTFWIRSRASCTRSVFSRTSMERD